MRLETEADYPHNGLSGIALDAHRGRRRHALSSAWARTLAFPIGSSAPTASRIEGRGGVGDDFHLSARWLEACSAFADGILESVRLVRDRRRPLFCIDNDPDASPPCRLIDVVARRRLRPSLGIRPRRRSSACKRGMASCRARCRWCAAWARRRRRSCTTTAICGSRVGAIIASSGTRRRSDASGRSGWTRRCRWRCRATRIFARPACAVAPGWLAVLCRLGRSQLSGPRARSHLAAAARGRRRNRALIPTANWARCAGAIGTAIPAAALQYDDRHWARSGQRQRRRLGNATPIPRGGSPMLQGRRWRGDGRRRGRLLRGA